MANRFYTERVLRSLQHDKPLGTVVILNGPPGSGKDTLAEILASETSLTKMAFKDELYEITAKYFGVPYDELVERASDRLLKETGWDRLVLDVVDNYSWMLTPREALIFVSERVYKPAHGEDYFGRAAVSRCIDRKAYHVVFSDGGFTSETEIIQKNCENLYIFHLVRDGFTFEGDSRDYVRGFANTYTINLIDGVPWRAITAIKAIVGHTL